MKEKTLKKSFWKEVSMFDDEQAIQALTLFDKPLRSLVFEENNEAIQAILSLFMDRKDLHIVNTYVDASIKSSTKIFSGYTTNPAYDPAYYDLLCTDDQSHRYGILFFENKPENFYDLVHNTRWILGLHCSLWERDFRMDSEVNMIVFTAWDDLKQDQPYYTEQPTDENGNPVPEDPGINLFINGKYQKDDAFGHLIADLQNPNPDTMYNTFLADRVRYYKKDPKGKEKLLKAYQDEKLSLN
jgi:hypothetical protein